MDHEYDIFEILSDGTPLWKGTASGKNAALEKLERLSESCLNELQVIHLPTKAILASKPARPAA